MVVFVVVCVSGTTTTDDDGGARLEGVAELVERVDGSSEGAGTRLAVCRRLCGRGVACGRFMDRDRLVVFLKWGTRCGMGNSLDAARR